VPRALACAFSEEPEDSTLRFFSGPGHRILLRRPGPRSPGRHQSPSRLHRPASGTHPCDDASEVEWASCLLSEAKLSRRAVDLEAPGGYDLDADKADGFSEHRADEHRAAGFFLDRSPIGPADRGIARIVGLELYDRDHVAFDERDTSKLDRPAGHVRHLGDRH